jgi:hypothetical protein
MPALDAAALGLLAPLTLPRHEKRGVGALRSKATARLAEQEARAQKIAAARPARRGRF